MPQYMDPGQNFVKNPRTGNFMTQVKVNPTNNVTLASPIPNRTNFMNVYDASRNDYYIKTVNTNSNPNP